MTLKRFLEGGGKVPNGMVLVKDVMKLHYKKITNLLQELSKELNRVETCRRNCYKKNKVLEKNCVPTSLKQLGCGDRAARSNLPLAVSIGVVSMSFKKIRGGDMAAHKNLPPGYSEPVGPNRNIIKDSQSDCGDFARQSTNNKRHSLYQLHKLRINWKKPDLRQGCS